MLLFSYDLVETWGLTVVGGCLQRMMMVICVMGVDMRFWDSQSLK